jgi:hypothetical protein
VIKDITPPEGERKQDVTAAAATTATKTAATTVGGEMILRHIVDARLRPSHHQVVIKQQQKDVVF